MPLEQITSGIGLPGTPPEEAASTRRNAYAELWDSLHGRGAWDKNPWVWVIEFRLSPKESSTPVVTTRKQESEKVI